MTSNKMSASSACTASSFFQVWLIGAPKNSFYVWTQGSHFNFCSWCGVAGSERVPQLYCADILVENCKGGLTSQVGLCLHPTNIPTTKLIIVKFNMIPYWFSSGCGNFSFPVTFYNPMINMCQYILDI